MTWRIKRIRLLAWLAHPQLYPGRAWSMSVYEGPKPFDDDQQPGRYMTLFASFAKLRSFNGQAPALSGLSVDRNVVCHLDLFRLLPSWLEARSS